MNREFDANLDVLIKALNASSQEFGEKFNSNPFVLMAYAQVYGQEQLAHELSSKQDLHMNRFFSITLTIENEIKNRKIPVKIAKNYADKIQDEIVKNHQYIFIIETAINRGDVDYAESLIDQLIDREDYQTKYRGYRLILKHYANIGDIDNFRKYLKLSLPGKSPKGEIAEFKQNMISTFSTKNGIDAGLTLCNDKVFGSKFSFSVIASQPHKHNLDELDNILDRYPVILECEPNAKAILYTKHFANKNEKSISDKDFERVLSEITKVDKSIKWGDGRLKDGLLCDLGTATNQKEQIIACKNLITAPFYKKELNFYMKTLKL